MAETPFQRFLDWTVAFRGRGALFRGVGVSRQMWPAAVRPLFRSQGRPLGTETGLFLYSAAQDGQPPLALEGEIARVALPVITTRMAAQEGVFTIQGKIRSATSTKSPAPV